MGTKGSGLPVSDGTNASAFALSFVRAGSCGGVCFGTKLGESFRSSDTSEMTKPLRERGEEGSLDLEAQGNASSRQICAAWLVSEVMGTRRESDIKLPSVLAPPDGLTGTRIGDAEHVCAYSPISHVTELSPEDS